MRDRLIRVDPGGARIPRAHRPRPREWRLVVWLGRRDALGPAAKHVVSAILTARSHRHAKRLAKQVLLCSRLPESRTHPPVLHQASDAPWQARSCWTLYGPLDRRRGRGGGVQLEHHKTGGSE